MPEIELEVRLPIDSNALSADLLAMPGVNYELGPFLKMTAPARWQNLLINDWPLGVEIFSSKILFLGVLPIDLHSFKLLSASESGFSEESKSLLNHTWSHERTITPCESGSVVKDRVSYKSRLGLLGYLFKPVYRAIFVHRHKRLQAKYT